MFDAIAEVGCRALCSGVFMSSGKMAPDGSREEVFTCFLLK